MNYFIEHVNEMYNVAGGDVYNIIYGFLIAGYFFLHALDAKKAIDEEE